MIKNSETGVRWSRFDCQLIITTSGEVCVFIIKKYIEIIYAKYYIYVIGIFMYTIHICMSAFCDGHKLPMKIRLKGRHIYLDSVFQRVTVGSTRQSQPAHLMDLLYHRVRAL